MELSDLTGYAREHYQIEEQHRWADSPGLSVLADPASGKWLALLMRQWDYDLGEMLECCDIKCGRHVLEGPHPSFVTLPFRMKGEHWVGVRMGTQTDPAFVYDLFDQAVKLPSRRLHYALLPAGTDAFAGNPGRPSETSSQSGNSDPAGRRFDQHKDQNTSPVILSSQIYTDTPLDFSGNVKTKGTPVVFTEKGKAEASSAARTFRDSAWDTNGITGAEGVPIVPEKILQMERLYVYGDGSFRQKCWNFYRQGVFMKDYEDDAPWDGRLHRYFPAYHDLNVRQLRGYFTWRTKVRRGEFTHITTSLAYIYLYELLNGIGADSPADAIRQMKAFESGFVMAGIVDEADRQSMGKNLRRWMMEFAVIRGLPPETARDCADPEMLVKDKALTVLKAPERYGDSEIWDALLALSDEKNQESLMWDQLEDERARRGALSGKQRGASEQDALNEGNQKNQQEQQNQQKNGSGEEILGSVMKDRLDGETDRQGMLCDQKHRVSLESKKDLGKHCRLMVEIYRETARQYSADGKDFFTACFGSLKTLAWHPLANALYWDAQPATDAAYTLDEVRHYQCHGGIWKEIRFEKLYFDTEKFQGLLHASDVAVNRYLGTGRSLRRRSSEAWTVPFINAVIAIDKAVRDKARAARTVGERSARLEKQQEDSPKGQNGQSGDRFRPQNGRTENGNLQNTGSQDGREEKAAIQIDFSSLQQIRKDAAVTLESLLTEEEKQEAQLPGPEQVHARPTSSCNDHSSAPAAGITESDSSAAGSSAGVFPALDFSENVSPAAGSSAGVFSAVNSSSSARAATTSGQTPDSDTAGAFRQPSHADAAITPGQPFGLDPLHLQLIRKLLAGQSITEDIHAHHLLPSVVTDTINEALYDEIGDNVLECDDDQIRLVEDYREDVEHAIRL